MFSISEKNLERHKKLFISINSRKWNEWSRRKDFFFYFLFKTILDSLTFLIDTEIVLLIN